VQDPQPSSLKYLFFTFLKIGATSWGGFMALISVIQKQIVERDKRISNEAILDGISLASVLPGPIAFNVVTFVGYKLKGIKGALVSMAGILLPSFLLMLLLSYLYLLYGDVPAFTHFFKGILPAVAAIILSVAFSMGKKNITDKTQILIALIAGAVIAFSKVYITTILVMLVSGIVGYLLYNTKSVDRQVASNIKTEDKKQTKVITIGLVVFSSFILLLILPFIFPFRINESILLHQKITATFSGMSLSLFGGGYVVIPAMQQVVVNTMHWLTKKEFADAIAMGQVTPGPIFISATFIGYKLAGFTGALNATLAIFLPPGILMIVCTRFFDKIRNSSVISAAFNGLRPAIIGMIAAAAFTIIPGSDLSFKTGLLFCAFLLLAIKYKTDPVYLIPGAGIIGLLIF